MASVMETKTSKDMGKDKCACTVAGKVNQYSHYEHKHSQHTKIRITTQMPKGILGQRISETLYIHIYHCL